jgi:predicted  nucleic acid-binding Zn-ribbon protein
MDGVSAAASFITIIDRSAKIASLCYQYLVAVKDAKKDIEHLRQAVTNVKNVLEEIRRLVDRQDKARLSATRRLSDSLDDCQGRLDAIKTKQEPRKTHKMMQRLRLQSLKWPFESSEVEKMVASLKEYQQTFNLALQVDNT